MINAEEILNEAFEDFKKHLQGNFDAVVKDEAGLKEIFVGQVVSLINAALENDAESGCFLDEMYGDGILECLTFPSEEEDEEDEEDEDSKDA